MFILVLALLPRVLNLNAFLTLDEFLWLDRSRNFILALQARQWGETFQTGHPGVTTMWAGSLGLWGYGLRHGMIQNGAFAAFLETLSWHNQPLDLHAFVSLPTALITSLGIAGIAWLAAGLFNDTVGWIVGVLFALDPWYLMHSRVLHHDALMSTFMTLAALALLYYIKRYSDVHASESSPWLLIFSGICTGLGLLSKTLSLFLFPWVALVFLLALWYQRRPLAQVFADGATWGLSTWTTCFVLWPAMWLRPFNTLWRMYQMATTYAINPDEKGQFFLGQMVGDPGPLFYPVVLPFALTPLVMLGVFVLFHQGYRALRAKRAPDSSDSANMPFYFLLLLSIYIVAYMVFVSFGEKKQERYLLPALLMLNVIAACGLYIGFGNLCSFMSKKFIRFGQHPLSKFINQRPDVLLMLCIVLMQGATSLPYHPYYTTYYNPLLGGNRAAARYLLVGWGEGNELAARYLNQLPDATQSTVVASTPTTFAPHFKGQTVLWWPEPRVFAADYAVLHRRNVQQGDPNPRLLAYIRETWPLEHTITLHGLPYVWIYRAPAADWTLSLEDQLGPIERTGLWAYHVAPKTLQNGETLTVTLYYRPRLTGQWVVSAQSEETHWNLQNLGVHGNLLSVESEPFIEKDVFNTQITSTTVPNTFQINIGFQREARGTVHWLTFLEPVTVPVIEE